MKDSVYELDIRKFKNTNKFREAAIQFEKHGYYTAAPKGTTAYYSYWDEESKRCLYGFTSSDGDNITGYHYFYLNYCQIVKVEKDEYTGKSRKIKGFPRFYDYDYTFFRTIEEAERQGKHLCVLKARRKGYSYKIESMLVRNFYFLPDSNSFAYASEKEFLIKDGILTKAWDNLDFIDENTAWSKKRQKVDQIMHKRASYIYDIDGVKTEGGFKSNIIGVTLKNDPQKARGKAGKIIVFEEAGKFQNLKTAWNIAKSSVEQGTDVFGIMVAFGTGGEEGADFEGLRDIFYEPGAYGCLKIKNIWDEGATDPCGFFVPDYYNYGNEYMDDDGNSSIYKAMNVELARRKEIISTATDRTAIDRHISEHCVDKDTWVSWENGIDRIINIPGNFCNGENDLYKLVTEDGTELLITKNHPIYNGNEYIELKNLKVGDTIKHLPINFNKEYVKIKVESDFDFLKYDLTIDESWGEFLGFYMGDGYFYSKTGVMGVVFDKKDYNSAEHIYEFLVDKFGSAQFRIIGNSYIDVRVTNKNLIKLVRSLDLIERTGTIEKWHYKRKVHVPDYIIKSPKSVISSFLRGYFDADGHVTKTGSSVGVGSKHKDICLNVQMLLRGFEINSKFSSNIHINGSGREYNDNRVSIRSCDVPKFAKEIRFVSERKNNIVQGYTPQQFNHDYSFTKIKRIEFFKKDLVYNLETKSHYYSANGIWVHNCFTPIEATLQLTGNIFPKEEIKRHLAYIRNTQAIRNQKQVGKLYYDENGLLKWEPSESPKDLTKYRLDKETDRSGEIVIWEHPCDNPPYGLYIAGADPYDHDKSQTDSLGSTFIYKRFQNFESYYDMIVAEYTGRPETAIEYYDNVLKLLKYYSATMLYENEKKGIFQHFATKNSEYLLADQPDIIKDIIKDSKVQRNKGVHMTTQIKDWGEIKIKELLLEDRGDGKLGLHTILSEPLLEELMLYNDKGNFDRVMAFMMVVIYRQELHKVHIKNKQEDIRTNTLFPEGVFIENSYKNLYEDEY